MKIGDYEFDGPFDSTEDLESASGLYAIVNVKDSGACILVEVRYSTDVKATVRSLVAEPSWKKRPTDGQLKYGVRYDNGYLEEDLKQALIDLESQYLVTCIL